MASPSPSRLSGLILPAPLSLFKAAQVDAGGSEIGPLPPYGDEIATSPALTVWGAWDGPLADTVTSSTVTVAAGGLTLDIGSAADLGHDRPCVVTGWEPVDWGSTRAITDAHALRLPDGTVLVAAYDSSSSVIYISRRVPSATYGWAWEAVTNVYASGPGCLVWDPLREQVSLLCYQRVPASSWSVSGYTLTRYDGGTDGTVWSGPRRDLLPQTGGNVPPYAEATPRRVRAAISEAGQWLVLAWLQATTGAAGVVRDTLYQHASADGVRWEHVYTTDGAAGEGAAYIDLVWADGRYHMAYLGMGAGAVNRLGRYTSVVNARDALYGSPVTSMDPLGSVPWGALDGSGDWYVSGELALVASETGYLLAYTRYFSEAQGGWIGWRAPIGGTWERMSRGVSGYDGDIGVQAGTTYLHTACAIEAQGQVLLLGLNESDSGPTYAGSLGALVLGGWSGAPQPLLGDGAGSRVTQAQTWWPILRPGDLWTETSVGTPTQSIASGRLVVSVTPAQRLDWEIPVTTSSAYGVMASVSLIPTSGTATITLSSSNGALGKQVEILIMPALVEVYDGGSGTLLGSLVVTPSGGPIHVCAHLAAAEGVRVMACQGPAEARAYETLCALPASLLTSMGGLSDGIRWGHGPGGLSTKSATWLHLAVQGGDYVGAGWIDAVEVLGRELVPGALSWLPTGVTVQPRGVGDWTVAPRDLASPARVLPDVSPSLRHGWRCDTTRLDATAAKIDLYYRLSGADIEDVWPGSDLLGIWLEDLYAPGLEIALTRAGGALVSVSSPTPRTEQLRRVGRDLLPITTSTPLGSSWERGEAAGAVAGIYKLTGMPPAPTFAIWAPIEGNTEGSTVTASPTLGASFTLATYAASYTVPDARTPAELALLPASPATVQVEIHPRRWLVVVSLSALGITTGITGVRLRVPVGASLPGPIDRLSLGKMVAGPVIALPPPDRARSRAILDSGSELVEALGGNHILIRRHRPRRAVDLAWTDGGLPIAALRATSSPPSWTWGASDEIARQYDGLALHDLLAEGLQGRLVVYLPSVPATLNAGTDARWGQEALYGRITQTDWRLDQATGDELVSEVLRGSTLTISQEV